MLPKPLHPLLLLACRCTSLLSKFTLPKDTLTTAHRSLMATNKVTLPHHLPGSPLPMAIRVMVSRNMVNLSSSSNSLRRVDRHRLLSEWASEPFSLFCTTRHAIMYMINRVCASSGDAILNNAILNMSSL